MILNTYGGGSILYKIFNGVGALCAPHSLYWTDFMVPALILGALWAATVAFSKADIGFFAKRWYIPTYLILTLILVPKTTIYIKDEVDPSFGFDTVDHIPIGLVFVASFSSEISHSMTTLIESVLGAPDVLRFSKTGYGFSSRLAAEARTLRISDPVFLDNLKDWTHQCIWLPYLKSNINGKGSSARNAQDLLGWVEEKGHPSLGTYWRENDGSKTYKTCKASVPFIREAFTLEEPHGIQTLLARLFGFSGAGGKQQVPLEKFKPYMEDAWQIIGKSTERAASHIQQVMIVNALKEGFDDGRDRFGYNRLYPELVSINAARSLEAQGMAGLIKGVSASLSLPLIQAFLVGFLSILFFLVIPFAVMPGGISVLGLWAKMLFSVQMWPVFGTLLNAISVLWMDRAVDSVLMGGPGFTIATTTGLTDAAGSVALWSSGLQLLVPALSWAFVSRSGHFLTTVIQSGVSSLESSASRLASDTVDGNVSLNNLSLMNKNLSSHSVAQQTLGMNQSFGSTVTTGDCSLVTALSGDSLVHQTMSTLRTALSDTNSVGASLGASVREAQALTEQESTQFQQAISDTSSQLTAYAEKLAKNISMTDGVSETNQATIQKTAEETLSLMDSLRKTHNLSAQTLASASLNVGLGLGRLVGIGSNVSASAHDQENRDKAIHSDEGRRLSQNVGKLRQFAHDHRGQITDSSGREASESLHSSFAHLQSSSDSFNRSYTRSKNLETLKNITENHSFGSTTNQNDAWLSYVAESKGFSKADAASFLENTPGEAPSLMAGFRASQQEAFQGFINGADHIYSAAEIADFLQTDRPLINPTGRLVHAKIKDAPLKTEDQLTEAVDTLKQSQSLFAGHTDQKRETLERDMRDNAQNLRKGFELDKEKLTITRAAAKIEDTAKALWQNAEKK
jgi:conjugal transfer mating pair stabilization protein TraG